MGRKRQREAKVESDSSSDDEPAVVRRSELEEPEPKKSKWINKQRVLVFGCRGLSYRDRHLMEDMKTLMPHSKSESKMRRNKESLFIVNEIAEMKNCNKCLLFEGRKKRDLYLWAANIARGPSAKFRVINVHTMAELKMTGNCLKGSRPLLSFDQSFKAEENTHYALLKELFIQIFGVPNHHPRSQPFFDRVYTFSVVDDKIWFRHYQILDSEDGSLAEIGPRFVLEPIKIFDASFSGRTLWENPEYVSPAAQRSLMKRMKAGKYIRHVESKAAYEANKPTEPTYTVDQTDDVFQTMTEAPKPTPDFRTELARLRKKKMKKNKNKAPAENGNEVEV